MRKVVSVLVVRTVKITLGIAMAAARAQWAEQSAVARSDLVHVTAMHQANKFRPARRCHRQSMAIYIRRALLAGLHAGKEPGQHDDQHTALRFIDNNAIVSGTFARAQPFRIFAQMAA